MEVVGKEVARSLAVSRKTFNGIPSQKRRRSPIIEGGLMRAPMTGHI